MMNRRVICLSFIALVAGLLAPPGAYALGTHPTAEDFAATPAIQALQLSPDGRYVAGVKSVDGRLRLAVFEAASGADTAHIYHFGEDRLMRVGWAGPKHLLLSIGTYYEHRDRGFYKRDMLVLDAEHGKAKRLINLDRYAPPPQFRDQIISPLLDDPEHILMGIDLSNLGYPDVYRVNIKTGRMERLIEGRAPIVSWFADYDGHVRGGIGIDGTDRLVIARMAGPIRDRRPTQIRRSEFREIARTDIFEDEEFIPLTIAPDDPNALLAISDHEGRRGIYRFDLQTRRIVERLFLDDRFDAESVVLSTDGARLIGFEYESEGIEREIIDPDHRRLQRFVAAQFPAAKVRLVSQTINGDRSIWRISGPTKAPRYYMVDRPELVLRHIGHVYPKLPDNALSKMDMHWIPTRDGEDIPVVLTEPRAEFSGPNEQRPGVVMVHGGPVARDSVSFSSLVQFLANRGYVVMQPNFRGSSGFGREFKFRGHNEWGRLMQRDVIDASRWFAGSGLVDPDRVCIMGASYGGYVTMLAASQSHELFACGISLNGVSDLNMLVENLGKSRFSTLTLPRISGGQSRKEMADRSPIAHVDDVGIPLLLLASRRDASVNFKQSRRMTEALRTNGKAVKFIVFGRAGHSLFEHDNRRVYFRAVEAFLAQNIGGRMIAEGSTGIADGR